MHFALVKKKKKKEKRKIRFREGTIVEKIWKLFFLRGKKKKKKITVLIYSLFVDYLERGVKLKCNRNGETNLNRARRKKICII